jgi:glucose-1-phosphate thymidylyltransferase
MVKKGIILAGGTGSRLFPTTKAVNKQLLMLYDKPVIFYPLSILMLAGIKDILIIVNKGQINNFKLLLNNGENYGIKISYLEQENPTGIPEAFKIGKDFIKENNVALILGDNFFFGQSLGENLRKIFLNFKDGANIFLKKVKNPENFGVAKIKNQKVINIIEKPKSFISNNVITGLYLFDNKVTKYTMELKRSKRGETEITDLIRKYHKKDKLKFNMLGIGTIWSDTGTVEDMHEVSNYVSSINKIQNFKIACLEEIALIKKWISKKQITKELKKKKINNTYQYYLNKYLS